jgi:hypothetical protein
MTYKKGLRGWKLTLIDPKKITTTDPDNTFVDVGFDEFISADFCEFVVATEDYIPYLNEGSQQFMRNKRDVFEDAREVERKRMRKLIFENELAVDLAGVVMEALRYQQIMLNRKFGRRNRPFIFLL